MSYCTSSREIQIQGNSLLCNFSDKIDTTARSHAIHFHHIRGFSILCPDLFFWQKIASKAISDPPFRHCLILLVKIWIFTKKQSLKAKSLVNKPSITPSRIIVAPLIMQMDLVSDLENCRGQIWDDGLKVWKIVITHCYIGKYQASAENETKPPPCSR